MNMLSYCRAMAAFCRQRARFDNEYEAFWAEEARGWSRLLSGHAGLFSHSLRPTSPRTRDDARAVRPGAARSADLQPDASGVARSQSRPARTAQSIRYRCPRTASERERCQACELVVEYEFALSKTTSP